MPGVIDASDAALEQRLDFLRKIGRAHGPELASFCPEQLSGQASMNLNFITGLQAGASQGAPLSDDMAVAASQAASPFAMLLAILSGTPAEAQTQAQPAMPQQSARNPLSAQKAQPVFLPAAQVETNEGQSSEAVPAVEALAEGFVASPAQISQIVPIAPEPPVASPPAADGMASAKDVPEQPGKDAVEQFEGEEIAAPLPAQPRADLAVIAAVSTDATLVQASQDANSSAPAQRQPSAALDGEAANNQAPVEIGKAAPAAIAGVAVDPRPASAAASNGKTPAAAPDLAEGVAPRERKQRAAADARSAPAPNASTKPDAALNMDTQTERPAPPAPADALKPAEPRVADILVRAPDSVAAAPAQQADAAMPRSAAQQATPQVPAAMPVEGLAIQIARVAKSGERKFEIRLDPPELGKVSVRLEVSREGVVTTHLTVERAETMDLLQRDARALERALGQAGLDQKGGGISFSLSDQNAHPQHDGREPLRRPYAMASEEMFPSDNPAQPERFRSADSLLDIRI